ncbi:MAG: single-stranded DNA-binding protein [Bacteroidetes bacterium]|nr:single-stranded DNA-binding protein [Bacteroidota bacterium]
MNTLKNRVQLIGNLGMDPEVKETGNGKTVARLSLATSESYKGKDGNKVDNTQWHKLVAWGNLADIAAKFLKKGQEVAVEGKLSHRAYNDKEGNRRMISEIIVTELLMLGSQRKA